MRHASIAAAAFLLLVPSTPAVVADVLVLDRAAKTVSRLDTPSLTVKASASLPDVPARAVLSPDGATAVVLCRGEGDDKNEGFQARTKAQAILLDAATLKERARVEVGWGLGPAIWDAAGRVLVVLSPGFPSTNPDKRQPASVVSVDLAGTNRRVQLDRAASEMVIAADGNVAAVLSMRVGGPPQLVFADLAAGTSGNAVVLVGEPKELLLAPDGTTLYVLHRGKERYFGNVKGSLTVFSLPERRKTGDLRLAAITGIGGFDRTGRLILGGAMAGDVIEQNIYVVKGGAAEWEASWPFAPVDFRFSPDGDEQRLAAPGQEESARTPLSAFDTALFEKTNETKTDGPADIVTGPSGEMLLLAKGLVATIDPATGKLAAQATSFGLPVIGTFLP